jgi:hypothetical protein
VLKCACLQALKTIRKTDTARGVPNERGRLVTRMKIGPREPRACSFAASDADVDEAGYSPASCESSGSLIT